MARVFTISFGFSGRAYTAVITQLKDSTTILLPDDEMQMLLPEGRISFNPEEGLRLDKPELSAAKKILEIVLEAIQEKCGPSI